MFYDDDINVTKRKTITNGKPYDFFIYDLMPLEKEFDEKKKFGKGDTVISKVDDFKLYDFETGKKLEVKIRCSKRIDDVIVVFKYYLTRVGTGPMAGELSAEETSQKGWEEFGTVTGRLRRAAEFDFELASRAIMLSSANQISITKLDVRFPDCAGAQSLDELGADAKSFIKNIEDKLGVKVTLIGTGAGVNDIIDLRT